MIGQTRTRAELVAEADEWLLKSGWRHPGIKDQPVGLALDVNALVERSNAVPAFPFGGGVDG
ncbi:hypothetical protein 7S3_38 [uncultured Caudovirales phage]|uniref:Uncharacterized protein n=1 Tax=uncultured Caudovirales phage TaxID=2100421 RepID=A0A2H4J9N0_9CAUD|nr:hypothetical protein 7S3_38 [uncultured Caudovirales phage]